MHPESSDHIILFTQHWFGLWWCRVRRCVQWQEHIEWNKYYYLLQPTNNRLYHRHKSPYLTPSIASWLFSSLWDRIHPDLHENHHKISTEAIDEYLFQYENRRCFEAIIRWDSHDYPTAKRLFGFTPFPVRYGCSSFGDLSNLKRQNPIPRQDNNVIFLIDSVLVGSEWKRFSAKYEYEKYLNNSGMNKVFFT